MNVYLSGFMAAGKTSVGRHLAARLGRRFVDLDEAIESEAGCPIREIFRRRGESGFRELERHLVERVVTMDGVVVALGGGTVVDGANRSSLRASGLLVWLDTPRSTILDRLEQGGAERPLYRDAEQATRLLEERRTAYGDCDLRLQPRADDSAAETAERLFERLSA